MTKREKADIKAKMQKAFQAVSTLYCSGEPFWSTTTITREQLDDICAGLNASKAAVAREALVGELTARVQALIMENSELRAALAKQGGTPVGELLQGEDPVAAFS